MIKQFVNAWPNIKESLSVEFARCAPETYGDLVRVVITELRNARCDIVPRDMMQHKLGGGDAGDYAFFFKNIPCWDYKYFLFVHYGSCSACDSLEFVRSLPDGGESSEKVKAYLRMALHIVQSLKSISDITVKLNNNEGEI